MQDVILSYLDIMMKYFDVVADMHAVAYSSEDGGGTNFVKAVKLIDKTETVYQNEDGDGDATLSGYTLYLMQGGSIAKYNRRGKLIALCPQCEEQEHREYIDTIDNTYNLEKFLNEFSTTEIVQSIQNALVERLEALKNKETELTKQFNRVEKLTKYYRNNL